MTGPVDAETYTAIHRLQQAYADISTRGAWDEVTSLLTPDAQVRFSTSSGKVFEIEGAQAFGEFGAKMTGFTFFQYIPLTFVVATAEDGTLGGRTYSLEVAETETGDWVESYSVYEDTYAQVHGEWRFARRRHQTVKQRITKPA